MSNRQSISKIWLEMWCREASWIMVSATATSDEGPRICAQRTLIRVLV